MNPKKFIYIIVAFLFIITNSLSSTAATYIEADSEEDYRPLAGGAVPQEIVDLKGLAGGYSGPRQAAAYLNQDKEPEASRLKDIALAPPIKINFTLTPDFVKNIPPGTSIREYYGEQVADTYLKDKIFKLNGAGIYTHPNSGTKYKVTTCTSRYKGRSGIDTLFFIDRKHGGNWAPHKVLIHESKYSSDGNFNLSKTGIKKAENDRGPAQMSKNWVKEVFSKIKANFVPASYCLRRIEWAENNVDGWIRTLSVINGNDDRFQFFTLGDAEQRESSAEFLGLDYVVV